MKNKPYFIALNSLEKVGSRTVQKLFKHWPNLEDLFKLPSNQIESFGVHPSIAHSIANFNWSKIEKEIRWSEGNGNSLLSWEDPEYPALLKETSDPPVVLYAKGNLNALTKNAVAIVGTRKPSIAGSENAWRFAFELAKHTIAIVSGLALGIDAQAHRGCIEAEGETIAVLGTGVDCIYPYRHKELADKILDKGLLLSEFPLHTKPIAGHFPRRNRIISGLSLATLVVEAAIRSGSLITARLALEQNRDVLAIPGSINNPQARGCHHLLQQGATLVTSVHDILTELRFPSTASANFPICLANENKNLVKFIGFEVTSIDEIQARSGLTVENVTCELAELEIKGIVKAVPGGYVRFTYER